MIFNQAFDLESPCRQVNFRRAMRIKHRPLLCTRLSRRNAVLASCVRTDDYLRFGNFFRRTRFLRLVFGIVDEAIEKAHKTEIRSQRSEVERQVASPQRFGSLPVSQSVSVLCQSMYGAPRGKCVATAKDHAAAESETLDRSIGEQPRLL